MNTATKFRLSGGRVYDPANGINGELKDIWIVGGKIAAVPPDSPGEFPSIDLSGRVVMPGGVDLHSHIVGPKVNIGRRLQPEIRHFDLFENRAPLGKSSSLPTLQETAWKYLGMGYTTVFDAAISPLAARAVHFELEHLPTIDAGFFVLAGNHHFLLESSARKDISASARYLKWLLSRCQAWAPKLVNPGGVENWKSGLSGGLGGLSEPVPGFATTPAKIIETLVQAANQLDLPHPLHIHCNQLGMPGNSATTLETLRLLGGQRAHLAHVQFHSYGGSDFSSMDSQVESLAAYVNAHPEISIDVGQVLFGKTISMTGDGPLGHYLSQLSRKKWYASNVEVESSCGISPVEYRDKSGIHALQWSIGLEWFLQVANPWQIALTTDHPNGGSFTSYPQIIHLLTSRDYREQMWKRLPDRVRNFSPLKSLTREYTLYEIAIITRAAPARILGLSNKGHLGVGADADLTVYTPNQDLELMFQTPWMVIKDGQPVIKDHEWVGDRPGRTWCLQTQDSDRSSADLEHWFGKKYSFSPSRFGMAMEREGLMRKAGFVSLK